MAANRKYIVGSALVVVAVPITSTWFVSVNSHVCIRTVEALFVINTTLQSGRQERASGCTGADHLGILCFTNVPNTGAVRPTTI